MKYIISGRHESKGVIGDDSADLGKYYELGWECVVSNIEIKNLLEKGLINKDDTIVTREDRKFIYSSVFKNVMDWDDFKKLNIPQEQCLNIDYFGSLTSTNYSEVNKELICNFDLITDVEKKYNINSDFICYCVRLRDHCDYRNSSVKDAEKTIKKIQSEFNVKVFVVGQNTEFLCDNENIIHVGLREFASLMSSKHCKCCISKLSGIIHLANFCAHEDLVNLIYDPSMDRSKAGENHPLFMGNNINYKNTTNIFIGQMENENLTVELIKKHAMI